MCHGAFDVVPLCCGAYEKKMGAEQSTPGEGPTAEGTEKPKPPTAMSLDQKSTQAVLAGMEGVASGEDLIKPRASDP